MHPESEKQFPDGRQPLHQSTFQFACHPGVSCFTDCCRDLQLFLYPFDIIQLKNRLQITSEEFLQRYGGAMTALNPFFPSVLLRMADNEAKTCPFLSPDGCTVYEDRPSACRTYPLERAVERTPGKSRPEEYYFLVRHPYCKGHEEEKKWTVKEWLRDQKLQYYNLMDDLWAEMDTLFRGNPWQGEGSAGPRQQLAFMVCYNIDGFRSYVKQHQLLEHFRLDRSQVRSIEGDDEALLRFGFDWLKYILAGHPTLRPRKGI